MSSPSFYQIRQCENAACGLRYPLTEAHPFGERCPLCLGTTKMVLQRALTADQRFRPEARKGLQIEALLDNVRSAWNVGAIFRTADAFGVRKLHLCGITPTPENPSVAKTALGADKSVGWGHSKNAFMLAETLKAEGHQLWALEQDEKALPTTDFLTDKRMERMLTADASQTDKRTRAHQGMGTDGGSPIVLIVGNEVTGVDPGLLDLCDQILYIPMRGEKRSLNVEVAFGVAVSWLVR